jgi:hypothetical protein
MQRSACLLAAILLPSGAFAQTGPSLSDFSPVASAQAAPGQERQVPEADGNELILAPELHDQPRAISGQEDR